MAWIEFHSTRIIRLKKFHDFRKAMNWSIGEALGYLGLFWGQTVEVCETGDVTGWTSEYLAGLVGLGPQVSERMLKSLVAHGWVDTKPDGRMLVHDWLDWAGAFLRSRYASGNREKLIEIWALHGRIYGKAIESNGNPIGIQLESKSTLPNPTKPDLTKPKKREAAPVRTAFQKPTPQEVTDYARSINYSLDGQHFVDSYEGKGWLVGKSRTPMKDWKAVVRTWKSREPEFSGRSAPSKLPRPTEVFGDR